MQPASIAFGFAAGGVVAAEVAAEVMVAGCVVVGVVTGMVTFLPSVPRISVTADTADVFCSTAPGTYFATVFACDCMPSGYSITVTVCGVELPATVPV